MSPFELTIADVRRHFTIEPGGNGWEWWSCGCHVKQQRRNWCPYHQGFFDGVEAAQFFNGVEAAQQ